MQILTPDQAIGLVNEAEDVKIDGYNGPFKFSTHDDSVFLRGRVEDDEGLEYDFAFCVEDNRSIKFEGGRLYLTETDGATESLAILRLAKDATEIDRAQFMSCFRSERMNEELTVDDCLELFTQSLKGSSDITRELLESVCSDYDVDLAEVATSTGVEGFSRTDMNGCRVTALTWDGTESQAEAALGAGRFSVEHSYRGERRGAYLRVCRSPDGARLSVYPGDTLFMIDGRYVYVEVKSDDNHASD